MNTKPAQFLAILCLYSGMFMCYHPEEGWYGSPLQVIAASLLFTSSIFTLLFVGSLLAKRLKIERAYTAITFGLLFTLLLWVQVDFAMNTMFGLDSISRVASKKSSVIFTAFIISIVLFCTYKLYQIHTKVRYRYTLGGWLLFLFFLIFSPQYQLPKVSVNKEKSYNVVIMSFDSLESEYMGSKNQNFSNFFPFLAGKQDEFLEGMENYPNTVSTHGTTAALYSGISTNLNHVIYTPDAFENGLETMNLPGVLKQAGYETSTSVTHGAGNARALKIAGAFDYINESTINPLESPAITSTLRNQYLNRSTQLFYRITTPIRARITKYFLQNEVIPPYLHMTDPIYQTHDDIGKQNFLLSFISKPRSSPFFIHTHYMITHAQDYSKKNKVMFPKIDKEISETYLTLEKLNLLEKTIFIITSDHGLKWRMAPVPLFVRFPNKEFAGKLLHKTQTIDIAATITAYLDIKHDVFFSGLPIFKIDDNNRGRSIIIATEIDLKAKWAPPFYRVGKYMALSDSIGQKAYTPQELLAISNP